MKIGDDVFIHGYVNEIRKDIVIIENKGGYFGTVAEEIYEQGHDDEQRTGHWFIDERPESNRETVCSICEQPVFKFHKLDFDYRPKYCPNCGAKMQ